MSAPARPPGADRSVSIAGQRTTTNSSPAILGNRPLMTLASGHFTVDMYAGLLPALYPMLPDRFAIDLTTVGLVTLANSAVSALSQPIFRWIAHRHGTGIVILSSLLLSIPVVRGRRNSLAGPGSSSPASLASSRRRHRRRGDRVSPFGAANGGDPAGARGRSSGDRPGQDLTAIGYPV